ncbi:zinc finger protein ZFP2-like [Leptopilina boulardi]|uniref:zinc finger protein ZFP2-like n=1 Tax=Leptopilina boulardi TaxID=63433 RepID=UPI0021F5377A|nr:zinc finger protein ZFP2-like [Leptopilina boulardi]XP_051153774.1 zinc finger protein ZFP2-like [Leptopilina boulardi]
MVGYYHQSETILKRETTPKPVAIVASKLEPIKPVKSLVCSPDLSAFTSPAAERLTTHNEKPYQCMLCQKIFDQKNVYQSHLRTHGKEGEDPYRCNICSKTFAVPARLTRHYRTHTGEKPYQCEYCNKAFSVKENLSVHRRIHTNERPYKCDVCERAFEHSGKLHRHMRIHTGERPHKCSVCEKTFIQSGQLVIHMRTHTGEKPYVCKSCGKGFTCSKQLKVHTRTHTGEKPYKCEVCGKSFGYNHVLKLHQVNHYGAKVYKCTLCNETFTNKKNMEAHIKVHSDSVPTNQEQEIAPNKENKTEEQEQSYNNTGRDFSYYVYQRDQYSQPIGGVNPALLAAAAAAAVEERSFQEPSTQVFLYPELSPAYSPYSSYSGPSSDSLTENESILNLPGNDARRRVEAALEAVEEQRQRECGINVEKHPILTPPSSNPVSPAPSPDPLDLVIPVKETLILPPRKRCKMILESMEHERSGINAQRQNSVIQFARAS